MKKISIYTILGFIFGVSYFVLDGFNILSIWSKGFLAIGCLVLSIVGVHRRASNESKKSNI